MNKFNPLAVAALLTFAPTAKAGVFNIPHFVDYQSWAVGLEPEVTLTNGGGFANNFKFTYGISPLSNFQAAAGFGTGVRGFRVGGAYTFDFIPDLDGQIGAGIAIQGYLYKLSGSKSQTEFTAIPYIHNAFTTQDGTDFDPYVALPIGLAFYSGTYRSIVQFVMGSIFPVSQHFELNAEVGLNFKDTDSYVSAGITYRD